MRTFQQEPRQSKGARPSSRTNPRRVCPEPRPVQLRFRWHHGRQQSYGDLLTERSQPDPKQFAYVRIKIGLELGLSEMGV
jgi:hypothetical protein